MASMPSSLGIPASKIPAPEAETLVESDAGSDAGSQGREEDRPALEVACLHPKSRRAALVSTTGSHCQVWRSTLKMPDSDADDGYVEFVIKYPRDLYQPSDARLLVRQYHLLREALGEIVPEALFVITSVGGKPNLVVIARAVNIWFNIANPTNREEAIGLLREHPLARDQLRVFVDQVRRWRKQPDPRVVDLYGLDNLVMDNQRKIRYVDSYYVFFFEDMLHLLGGEPDYELEDKIRVSLRRLTYLEEILQAAEQGRDLAEDERS